MTQQTILDELFLLFNSARHDDLESRAVAILRETPEALDVLNILGASFFQRGLHDRAISVYRRMLEINPAHAPAHGNLGLIHKALGDMAAAVGALSQAVTHAPDDAVAHFNLANAYCEISLYDKAIAAYDRALAIRPDFALAERSLALAWLEMTDFDKALDCARACAARYPDYSDAQALYITILERMNKIDEAEKAFASLASVKDAGLMIAGARLDLRRRNDAAAAIKLKAALAMGETVNALDRAAAYYLLGGIYDRAHQEKAAIGAFSTANGLRKNSADRRHYKREDLLERIAGLKAAFKGADTALWRPPAPVDQPCEIAFLVGFPRSGTTLLNQLLASHPQIEILDERPAATDLAMSLKAVGASDGGEGGLFPELSNEQRAALQARYFETIAPYLDGRRPHFVVDKMPVNMIYAAQLALIFPQAKFIFLTRHPHDAVLSCFMQHFKPNSLTTHFYSLEEAAHLYGKAMDLWRDYEGRTILKTHQLRYEDLVTDMTTIMQSLAVFLGIDWRGARFDHLYPDGNSDRVASASYSQVMEPVHDRAIARWRRYEAQLTPLSRALAPWRRYFGYEAGDLKPS